MSTPQEKLRLAQEKTHAAEERCEELWIECRQARLEMNRARRAYRQALEESPGRAMYVLLPVLEEAIARSKKTRGDWEAQHSYLITCTLEEAQAARRVFLARREPLVGSKGGECPPLAAARN